MPDHTETAPGHETGHPRRELTSAHLPAGPRQGSDAAHNHLQQTAEGQEKGQPYGRPQSFFSRSYLLIHKGEDIRRPRYVGNKQYDKDQHGSTDNSSECTGTGRHFFNLLCKLRHFGIRQGVYPSLRFINVNSVAFKSLTQIASLEKVLHDSAVFFIHGRRDGGLGGDHCRLCHRHGHIEHDQ
ncbi:protein of unknown function [Pseudodesulfovibrio profundus]|uniref:Uncharacterized protein n=1 Tax=Pseudodesulfovibrio profundus TaxID=57320 RepID=A0A2C8F9K1_9BACT|nr:protein of unknown function [Pseudodesulfovibrio profundus]